jgi:hypothetical protein
MGSKHYVARLPLRKWLEKNPGGHRVGDLVRAVGACENSVRSALAAMKAGGEVTIERVQLKPLGCYGLYTLVPGSACGASRPMTEVTRAARAARDFAGKQVLRERERRLEAPASMANRMRSHRRHDEAESVEEFLARGGTVERL